MTRPSDHRLPWVVAGYAALAVVATWPLSMGLARDVPGDLGDSLLNMWILAWGAEQVPRLLTGASTWTTYWNGNIFHPEPYSLALSEHLFGQVLQILPVYALTGNIILCYNLLFLGTFVISALGAYLLARDLTGDWRAAVLAGLAFGFVPYRLSQVPHLQVMSSQWMPLALWGVHRFIVHRSTRGLVGGTAALVLQNWSCGYYVLYFAPFVPLFAVDQLWRARRLRDARAWGGLALAGVVTVALTLPFLLPYLEVQRLFAFERPFGEVVAFSANVWSYATAAEPIHLWGRWLRLHPHGEGETFLGLGATVLMLVALVGVLQDARRASRDDGAGVGRADAPARGGWRRVAAHVAAVVFVVQGLAWLGAVLAGGITLSVGGLAIRATTPVRLLAQAGLGFLLAWLLSPRWRRATRHVLTQPVTAMVALMVLAMWLSLGPLPSSGPSRVSGFGVYGLLYEYVPGFTGVRVPARYAMVAAVFLSISAAYGAARLGGLRWGRPVLVALGLLVIADGAAMPLAMNHTWASNQATPPGRVFPAASAPAVYQDLAALPPTAVVAELPFGDPAWEIRAVYYASVHGKPVVNGYSGAFPPGYRRRAAALTRLDADPDLAWTTLMEAGTTHVVVHRTAFADVEENRAAVAWLQSRGARLVRQYPDEVLLFAVGRAAGQ